ncbi:hypothetical protein ACOME3_009862 [Neoechinorhynchus agilis]
MSCSFESCQTSANRQMAIKLNLLCRLSDFAREVTGAALISDDDGFITISSDRSVRVWLKRESGRFWPSVCQYLPVLPSCLEYVEHSRQIFVGLEDGLIMGYLLSDDLNSVSHVFDCIGHSKTLSALTNSHQHHWLLSTGQDKLLCYHSTQDGALISSLSFSSPTTCICVDEVSGCVFIGEQCGHIQFLNSYRREEDETTAATCLVGHSGSVKCLCWDAETERLFSASCDVIIVWDIGNKRGERFELHGQPDDVNVATGLSLMKIDSETGFSHLIAAYENGVVAFWNISKNVNRMQVSF